MGDAFPWVAGTGLAGTLTQGYYISPLRGGFYSSSIGINLFVNHFQFNPLEQNSALPI
jgi:hypothetical protein